jgi:hypothetical protein
LHDVLGLLMLTFYIVTILGISAAVTLGVIKIFPTQRNSKKPDDPDAPATGNGAEVAGGRLFRRAKRESA